MFSLQARVFNSPSATSITQDNVKQIDTITNSQQRRNHNNLNSFSFLSKTLDPHDTDELFNFTGNRYINSIQIPIPNDPLDQRLPNFPSRNINTLSLIINPTTNTNSNNRFSLHCNVLSVEFGLCLFRQQSDNELSICVSGDLNGDASLRNQVEQCHWCNLFGVLFPLGWRKNVVWEL